MIIKELKIFTQDLTKQIAFYSDTLGLNLVERSDNQAAFEIGRSILTLIQRKQFTPYHFAINIPCNQHIEALDWLKKRVEILTNESTEIHDFEFWNAKSIYFYDMDKNIVEFIARNNLKNERHEHFGFHSLLEISEIGVPVGNIQTTFNSLKNIPTLYIYDGELERFCAIGDEEGLFICINKDVKKWFPTGDQASSSEFEMKFIENGKPYHIAFNNEELKVIAHE